jgi:hypothetical protein
LAVGIFFATKSSDSDHEKEHRLYEQNGSTLTFFPNDICSMRLFASGFISSDDEGAGVEDCLISISDVYSSADAASNTKEKNLSVITETPSFITENPAFITENNLRSVYHREKGYDEQGLQRSD